MAEQILRLFQQLRKYLQKDWPVKVFSKFSVKIFSLPAEKDCIIITKWV